MSFTISLTLLFWAIVAVTGVIKNVPLIDSSPGKMKSEWEKFQFQFNKHYASEEETQMRYDIFATNVAKINEHNKNYPDISFTMGITKFADWTDEEFLALNNYRTDQKSEGSLWESPPSDGDLPAAIDWSTVSPPVMTPIKDQGNCGSCWAFGATASWETRSALETGTLNSLSEQELVDCVLLNDCILGGTSDQAFWYGIWNDGLSLESEYVYTARDHRCNASLYTHYDPLKSMYIIPRNNETAMMEALQTGPITVAVDAAGPGWSFYRSGVYDAFCGTNLDHCVAVVGYGVDADTNQAYWKIRNSWGTSWGENGYMRMCRDCGKNGDEGECGINTSPSFPIAK